MVKRGKKIKKMSLRKGRKITAYLCKLIEKTIETPCDLQSFLDHHICPEMNIAEEDGKCSDCKGVTEITFQIVDKKLRKPE